MTTKDPTSRLAGVVRRITNQFGDLWIAFILVGLMGFFAILTPAGTFLSLDNFRDIALNTSQIVLLAAGQTFILIAAGIDLSVGSITIFCAVIAAKLLGYLSGPVADNYPDVVVGLAVALPLTLVAGCAWGFVNGWITIKWRVPPFIVTLGTLGIALGLAQIISGGLNMAVPPQLQETFTQGELFGIVPWPVVLASGVVAILWAVLARTRFGLRVYALGANMEALRRAGVNVGRLTGNAVYTDGPSVCDRRPDGRRAVLQCIAGGTHAGQSERDRRSRHRRNEPVRGAWSHGRNRYRRVHSACSGTDSSSWPCSPIGRMWLSARCRSSRFTSIRSAGAGSPSCGGSDGS